MLDLLLKILQHVLMRCLHGILAVMNFLKPIFPELLDPPFALLSLFVERQGPLPEAVGGCDYLWDGIVGRAAALE
jgi:hypothetical protein